MGFDLGDTVPAFELPDTNGELHAVPVDPAPKVTAIVVTCNHCPYVHAWNPRLRKVAEDYEFADVRLLQINSNDAERYPADSLDRMKQFVADQSWPIPYLHDETQEVARALGAVATPHVFVLDGEHRLVYRGAPDADHQDESQDARWLRDAIEAVIAGNDVPRPETPPRGCSVKWRD